MAKITDTITIIHTITITPMLTEEKRKSRKAKKREIQGNSRH